MSMVVSFKGVALAVALALSAPAAQAACSEFERDVLALADAALEFQQTEEFAAFGFAVAGPYHGWLAELEVLRDAGGTGPRSANMQFLLKYGFVPFDLHTMAMDHLRLGGSDFAAEIEDLVRSADPC